VVGLGWMGGGGRGGRGGGWGWGGEEGGGGGGWRVVRKAEVVGEGGGGLVGLGWVGLGWVGLGWVGWMGWVGEKKEVKGEGEGKVHCHNFYVFTRWLPTGMLMHLPPWKPERNGLICCC